MISEPLLLIHAHQIGDDLLQSQQQARIRKTAPASDLTLEPHIAVGTHKKETITAVPVGYISRRRRRNSSLVGGGDM